MCYNRKVHFDFKNQIIRKLLEECRNILFYNLGWEKACYDFRYLGKENFVFVYNYAYEHVLGKI